jgi:hypothetical protein
MIKFSDIARMLEPLVDVGSWTLKESVQGGAWSWSADTGLISARAARRPDGSVSLSIASPSRSFESFGLIASDLELMAALITAVIETI